MNLGERMADHERASRTYLPKRMPIILRVDGKGFHTYLKDCKRPFDKNVSDVMDIVATELCRQIQGAQMAYSQSDEISVLVHPYKRLNSDAWFDNRVDKMVSVAASIASVTFTVNSWKIWCRNDCVMVPEIFTRAAYFDARAFVLPESEVANYFVNRQNDATRNSVQSLAQSLFSHKECISKSCVDLQTMCLERGFDWTAMPTRFKRGLVIDKCEYVKCGDPSASAGQFGVPTNEWRTDLEVPIFTKNRDYIERHLAVDSE